MVPLFPTRSSLLSLSLFIYFLFFWQHRFSRFSCGGSPESSQGQTSTNGACPARLVTSFRTVLLVVFFAMFYRPIMPR